VSPETIAFAYINPDLFLDAQVEVTLPPDPSDDFCAFCGNSLPDSGPDVTVTCAHCRASIRPGADVADVLDVLVGPRHTRAAPRLIRDH
jgi:hypothetical protein